MAYFESTLFSFPRRGASSSSSRLDTVSSLVHTQHKSTVSWAANWHRNLWQYTIQRASSIQYCQSLASL